MKTAVIGFGFMGAVHAKNILANANLELCGIVDNRNDVFKDIESTGNHGNLNLSLEKLRQVPVFKTVKECVYKVHPDAVIICVPLFLHYKIAKEALNLGLNVLLEKPFCPEVSQCRGLIDLAKEKKRLLMVAHCIRFAPEWEFLAECIKDKRYGELKLLSASRTAGEPTWGVWQDEKIKKSCGGAIMDLLIHDIDFVNYCLGKPEAVKQNLNIDEYWEMELKYKATPAKVSINGGFLHRNTPFASECIAAFEQGSLRFSSLQPGTIHIGLDTGEESIKVSGDMYANELEYFVNCISKNENPEKCLPEASMQTIEVCRKISILTY